MEIPLLDSIWFILWYCNKNKCLSPSVFDKSCKIPHCLGLFTGSAHKGLILIIFVVVIDLERALLMHTFASQAYKLTKPKNT